MPQDPTPPPLPPPGPEPPPAPLPLSFVREGLSRLRIPALVLLVGVAAQAIIYLIATGWMVFLLVMIANAASSGGGGGNPVPGLVMFGLGAAFNLLSLIVLAPVAYGAVRMMRAHGYGWAIGGAITQIAWGVIHGMLMLYSAFGLGCVLAPVEVLVAVTTGSVALFVLGDNRIQITFQAVERHPELLSESAAEG